MFRKSNDMKETQELCSVTVHRQLFHSESGFSSSGKIMFFTTAYNTSLGTQRCLGYL